MRGPEAHGDVRPRRGWPRRVLWKGINLCITHITLYYKMGEKCDFIKGVQGSSGILYLLLGIFGLSIVDFCLIQDTINKSV